MKKISISIIKFYQALLSPDQSVFSSGRKYCVFYPTCSEYTKEAIRHGGLFYGIHKGIFRIARCHPWQKNIIDPFKI